MKLSANPCARRPSLHGVLARMLGAAALVFCGAASGQDDTAVAAEHARIAAEREQAQARFTAQEKACYRNFAVDDCINEARSRRRTVMSDLRRQEVSLADAQRKRKAADRVRNVEERSSPQRQDDAARRRADAVDDLRQRQERAAAKAAAPAASAAAAGATEAGALPRPAAARKPPELPRPRQARSPSGPTPQEAADHARAHDKRLQAAHERRERAARRVAERKAASAPLPVPP
jgi:hypothetical protein